MQFRTVVISETSLIMILHRAILTRLPIKQDDFRA